MITGITVVVEGNETRGSGDECTVNIRVTSDDASDLDGSVLLDGNDDEDYPEAFNTTDIGGTDWSPAALDSLEVELWFGSNDCQDDVHIDHVTVEVDYETLDQAAVSQPSFPANVCLQANFNFVVDVSASVNDQTDGAGIQQLRDGIEGFVAAYEAIGDGRYSLSRFSDSGTLLTDNPDFVDADALLPLLTGIASGTYTNTADGIDEALSAQVNNGGHPGAPMIMFIITDGSPNRYPGDSGSPSLSNPQVWLDAADQAIGRTDDARQAGYIVYSIFVGEGDENLPWSSNGDQEWIDAVMLQYAAGDSSYARSGSFADLAASLISSVCGGQLSVTKIIQDEGGNEIAAPSAAHEGWTFPASSANGAVSLSPTNNSGQTSAQINFGANPSTQITVSETNKDADLYTMVSAECKIGDNVVATDNDGSDGLSLSGVQLNNDQTLSCEFVNRLLPQEKTLTICKVLVDNGVAPSMTGQGFGISVGGSSIGTATVNEGGPAACVTTEVEPGTNPTIAETLPANFVNDDDYPRWSLAPQAGSPPTGTTAFEGSFQPGAINDDTTVYIYNRQAVAGIQIVKLTNDTDNNSAPGLLLPVGSTATFTYQVTNTGDVPLSSVVVNDDGGPDPSFNPQYVSGDDGDNVLEPGEVWIYEADREVTAGQYTNMGSVSGTSPDGQNPTAEDPDNHFGADPGITIEKSTNGQDADDPTGPYVPVGGTVNWEYVVTNTGNVALSSVTVTDDQGVTVTCPLSVLAASGQPGSSMTCTASGLATAGQYANIGSVTALDPTETQVSDTDPSHYFGADPDILIVKYTNGADANSAPGITIAVGGNATFTYHVTIGDGNVALGNVVVTDDNGTPGAGNTGDDFAANYTSGDDGDNILEAGETWIFTAPNPHAVTAGQYTNIGTATGNPVTPTGTDIAGATDPIDDDPSNHFGAAPGIDIEKSTNGSDSDDAPGAYLVVGDPVTWTYTVTNPGNQPLADVVVTDDNGTADTGDDFNPTFTGGDTNSNNQLDPGEVWTYTANGLVEEGPYQNMGHVTGEPPTGSPPEDEDPSNYFGVETGIQIVKLTNGTDNNSIPGPSVEVGSTVTFTYQVTNEGNVPLDNIEISDDNGTPGDTGDDITPVYQSGDTNSDDRLDVNETWIFTATREATAGQYTNLGTVSGDPETPEGDPIPEANSPEDTDPDNHFGTTTGIEIVKLTNGTDNNTAPGPYLPVGSTVTWTYQVTNLGNVTLTNVEVTDSIEGAITCPGDELAPNGDAGDSMTCTETATVQEGSYTNMGTVTADPPEGPPVTDNDPDNYFGYELGIHIEKATNGEDADTGTGPLVLVGSTVTFTYEVTNTGNLPLANVSVTDDQGVTPVYESGDTDTDNLLDVDETWIYTATHIATAGQYTNIGTATGDPTDTEGNPTELPQQQDTDPSNHYGQEQFTVTVCKIVTGNGDGQPNGGTFSFSSLTQGLAGSLTAAEGDGDGVDGAADCSLTATVTEGASVTVSESAGRPAGWTTDETGYPTTTVNNGTAVSQSSVTVEDIQGDVTITFRNRAEPLQRLRVCKDVIDSQQNAPATDWTFNSSVFDANVTLTGVEASDTRLENCSDWMELGFGTQSVTVTETDPGASWDTSWNVDTIPVNQGSGTTATFDLGDQQDHTLVFTNERILIPVQVCKRVIDNGAAPGGEGATFPVDIDFTRNGQASNTTVDLTQDEDNDSEAACETVLIDRGSTVTVDETTLPAGWAAAGATLGSTAPPAGDNLPFTSPAITTEGQTLYVFNELGTFGVTVCKVIDQNEDVEGTESGTFNFGGGLGTFSLVADGECEVVTVSSGADITVTENGAPSGWQDAFEYPQVQVNDGGRTVDTDTVTVNDITADTTLTFYNKIAPDPVPSKTPADIAYENGFARWQIIIDNTADGAREHRVNILDADVVLDGAAPDTCDSGDITNSEDRLSCILAPGETLVINVQRAIGQTCIGGEAGNVALISFDEGVAEEVVSSTIEIPADESLCDDPLIEKESLGYNAANGVVTWRITVDNSNTSVEGAIERTILITDPGVVLSAGLPQGCTGAIATGMTCVVPADTVLTFQVQRSVTEQCQPGQAANQATATIDGANIQGSPANAEPVIIPADEDACIVPPLDKDAIGYDVDVDTASWSISVDNTGFNTIERTVVVTDDNVTLVTQSPTNACTGGTLATGLTCTIPAGTELLLTVERQVAQTCQPGVAINTAEASLDGEPLPGSPAVAAPIIVPGVDALCDPPDLEKVATGFVTASNLATWRVVVANDAPGAIDRTVVVTDPSVDVALTLPADACDTAGSDIETGLVCEVAAGATLQIFVTRGPIGQICAPQEFANTATGTLLNGDPLDGSPAGPVTVTVPALNSVLCEETEIPTPTPTIPEEPEETPTPTNTPEPEETPTGEPTAVLPTVVAPPTETATEEPTATNTPEPTATNTPEPTAVLPTVVVPTPPDSGTGFSPIKSNEPTFIVGLLGMLLLGAGVAIILDGYRNRI